MTLFGSKTSTKPTVNDQTRQMKRTLNKEKRSIDRDVDKLANEEKRILAEIKAAARKGDNKQAQVLAKQIIQLRKTKERLQETNAKLGGLQAQATNMQATAKLGEAMKNTTGIMVNMNKQMNLPEMQETMKAMQREHMKAEMKDEMISDMFEMMDPDDIEEEMSDEVSKVMDELAIDARSKMPALNTAQATSSTDAELQQRLAQLGI